MEHRDSANDHHGSPPATGSHPSGLTVFLWLTVALVAETLLSFWLLSRAYGG